VGHRQNRQINHTMDTIIIHELEVFYQVGVTESERAAAQRLLLNLEIQHDFTQAVSGDDLAETVDYEALSQRLLSFGEGCHWRLIETLASDIAAMILEEYPAQAVTVEVQKFCLPQTHHVAVRLTRSRR
jgi:FolB domain-containing protein